MNFIMTFKPMKLKPKWKKKWLEALRSGEYKQGRRRLKTKLSDGSYEYCCLGVLCEITGLSYSGSAGLLPSKVVNLVYEDCLDDNSNFTDNRKNPYLYDPILKNTVTAVSANDTFNRRFDYIANMVESAL